VPIIGSDDDFFIPLWRGEPECGGGGALSLAFCNYKKWQDSFLVHEIGRINGGKIFQNGGNVF
jgi:hypothetical protein